MSDPTDSEKTIATLRLRVQDLEGTISDMEDDHANDLASEREAHAATQKAYDADVKRYDEEIKELKDQLDDTDELVEQACRNTTFKITAGHTESGQERIYNVDFLPKRTEKGYRQITVYFEADSLEHELDNLHERNENTEEENEDLKARIKCLEETVHILGDTSIVPNSKQIAYKALRGEDPEPVSSDFQI